MSERRDNIWLAGHYILTMVTSLITLKFNIMNFGSDIFGVWVLLSSIWGLSNVLDLGFGLALIRAVSKNKSEETSLKQVASTGLAFFLLFGLVILVAGLLVGNYYYVGDSSLVGKELYTSAFTANILLGVFFYLNYISTFFRSVYEGLGLFVFYSKIAIIYSVLTLSAAVVSWIFHFDIQGLALLMVIAALLQLILLVTVGFVAKKLPALSPSGFKTSVFKELFAFSISVQGATVIGTAIDPVVKYLIGSGLSVAYVGYYDIAKRFAQASSGLFFAAFRTIYPKASRIVPGEEKAFLISECLPLSRKGILTGGLFFMGASPVFAVIFIFFYDSPLSFNIFLLLAMVESVNLFGYSYYSMLMGIGKANFLALMQLINLTGVSFFLWLGIKLTGSYAGIGGYALTVVIANILILLYTRKLTAASGIAFFKAAGGLRLVLQFFAISTAFLVLQSTGVGPLFIGGGLFGAWLLIYGTEIRSYSGIVANLIKRGG